MRNSRKIIALLLLSAILLSLAGCSAGEKEYQKDIIFTEDVPLPEELYLRAEEVFFGLLLCYTKQSTTPNPSEKLISELCSTAKRGVEAISGLPVSPEGFGIMLDILESDGEAAVSEISGVADGFKSLRAIYLSLAATVGADYIGYALFELTTLYYELSYEKSLDNYDKYGYTYLLEDAETALENKRVLAEEIGREDFKSFVIGFLALGDLMFGKETVGDLSSFSDEELLLFSQSLSFDYDITEAGYNFLIYNMARLGGKTGRKISEVAKENGDCMTLAGEMDELLLLIRELQSLLVAEDMVYVREGNDRMVISLAFSRLSDEGWQRFRQICESPIHPSEYDSVMTGIYGDEYARHLSSITPTTFDDLKASAGSEEFYEGLKGYLGGICPAVSFGMK